MPLSAKLELEWEEDVDVLSLSGLHLALVVHNFG